MIKYLLHTDIDFYKYDKCISESYNSMIYGCSWYLNCVTDSWDVLILNDYEAVMPLPIRNKFGINYIFLPAWIQQLGIFSINEIQTDLILDFINTIPNKFKLVDILFNHNNSFQHDLIQQRENYILELNDSYKNLFKNFKKGRKSSIRKSQKSALKVQRTDDFISIIDLFKINKGAELKKTELDYNMLRQIISKAIELHKVEIFNIVRKDNYLLGGAVFLNHGDRIIYLFSAVNQEGRKDQAISLLIDGIINKYAESNKILDFEGSMIKDIASFYKSFGAVKETYYFYKKPFNIWTDIFKGFRSLFLKS